MSSFFNLTRLKQIFSRPSFLCCSLPEDPEQTLRKVHIPPCLPGIRGTYNSFFSSDLAEQSGKGGPILYGCSLGQNFPAPDASTSTGLHSFDNIQFFAKCKLMQPHQLLLHTYYYYIPPAKFLVFFFSTCTVVTPGSPCVHPYGPWCGKIYVYLALLPSYSLCEPKILPVPQLPLNRKPLLWSRIC